MLPYPEIDPVLLHLGPLQVRWYGLMYVLGFIASYLLVQHQIKRYNLTVLAKHFENLNLVLIVSLVLGARLGYVLFYNPSYYLANPQDILATWQGGMSFHGAL
ncbi:MAG: prolipoprotein diacylglyceryl transferase, partial [Desulfurivibrionaceae bacterium]